MKIPQHPDINRSSQFPADRQVLLQSRLIGDLSGETGPNVVFFGGIHGNEPSGVLAIQRVFGLLKGTGVPLRGRIMGLAGNLPALAINQRFISKDLNRLWNAEFTVRYARRHETASNGQALEYHQQYELFDAIEPFLNTESTSYFLDLHTTSSQSVPFIGINDQLNNRKFALQFPVATVLGLEEYLDGPLLSYLNEFGHVALAFEAGQHDAAESMDLHVEFILKSLLVCGAIDEDGLKLLEAKNEPPLAKMENTDRMERGIYEIVHRRAIVEQDEFEMKTGFQNFSRISHGELLANDREGPILAPRSGRIFMPLYQGIGNDGFFIVRKVPRWALKLSTVLRKINFERFLLLLPGVSRRDEYPDALVVDERIAFLLATQLFHLLGYRRKKKDATKLIFSRREIVH